MYINTIITIKDRQEITAENVVFVVSSLKISVQYLLEHLLIFTDKYDQVYIGQDKTGKRLGYSRKTINEGVAELRDLGFLTTRQTHANTLDYYINPIFRQKNIRQRLSFYFAKIINISLFLTLVNAVQERRVTLLNTRELESFNIYLSTRESYKQRAREGDTNKGRVKVRRSMETDRDLENFITPALRQATEILQLTKWGQIRLAAFDDNTIRHGLQQLTYAKPQNAFMWFFKVCLQYCQSNKLAPDWGFLEALSKKYDAPQEPKFTRAAPKFPEKGKSEMAVSKLHPVFSAPEIDIQFVDQSKQAAMEQWRTGGAPANEFSKNINERMDVK